ncbi:MULTISPECIES: hypothetical protein [Alphaproteobacteria]|uniref:hypothetical protein n=1 Tax=Alphaproteobacteria TaxID=28211 RepID=UPI0005E83086|nr:MULTISPECIES: hypothetical protein [Alphaproteobacteria]CDO34165.1 exported hypothetical protein [Novosphingobium sp. KN65.2]
MKWIAWPLLLMASVAGAQDHHQHHNDKSEALGQDAHIVVTINPEARVSAALHQPLPLQPKCGDARDFSVEIINQGFVTAPLRAAIIDGAGDRVALHMDVQKLSGRARDLRRLHLTPLDQRASDVTVAFSLDHNVGDQGKRDRVHILMRCRP